MGSEKIHYNNMFPIKQLGQLSMYCYSHSPHSSLSKLKRVLITLIVVMFVLMALSNIMSFSDTNNAALKFDTFRMEEQETGETFSYGMPSDASIKIAVTSCGVNVLEQTLVMLKSAMIFTKRQLHFIIISDLSEQINDKILEWPSLFLERITYEILTPSFPNVTNPYAWKAAFAPCSSQRLFYPLILPQHDAVLHIDSDVIFLTPPELLHSFFSQMNSTQIAAMATDDMNPNTSWYKNFQTAPYVTQYALNAGIMLMNLTRMRQVNYHDALEPIAIKWNKLLPWFDQDVLNVYFHDHPDQFLELPCRFNYLTDHCSAEKKQFCESAEKDGVAILHGSRGVFHKHTHLAFKAVYESIRDYKVTTTNTQNLEKLLISLMLKLSRIKENVSCGNVSRIFTKTLKDIVMPNSFYQLREV